MLENTIFDDLQLSILGFIPAFTLYYSIFNCGILKSRRVYFAPEKRD